MLKRIQDGGKLLELACKPWEVFRLFEALEPQGVLIYTSCSSPAEADALVVELERRFGATSLPDMGSRQAERASLRQAQGKL